MNKKSRSLELFFVNGNPDGMLTATIPFQWSGHVLVANRMELPQALKRPETQKAGLYLLVGESDDSDKPLLYIGESDDVGQRVKEHRDKKEWWDTVIFITSNGDHQLNKAHVRFLESRLIQKANELRKVNLQNGNGGMSGSQLSEASYCHMEDFLDNIFLVLPALRFDFFLDNAPKKISAVTQENETTPENPVSPVFVLTLAKENITAEGMVIEGKFVVLKGSQARKEWVGARQDTYYKKIYDQLIQQNILAFDLQNLKRIFSQDYSFESPSAAGAIITGRETNGRREWKLKGTSKIYHEWEKEQL